MTALTAPLSAMPRLPTLVWDLGAQPASLGGALTLRAEAEVLAQVHGCPDEEAISLWVRPDEKMDVGGLMMLRRVFLSSQLRFEILLEPMLPLDGTWPDALTRGCGDFAYYNYDRLTQLCRRHGVLPRLRWSNGVRVAARKLRRYFGDRLYCVHLRHTGGGRQDSDADFAEWSAFFQRRACPGRCEFLLLGDDRPGSGWRPVAGVYRAADLGIDLISQLALVDESDGYLGMASGIGCAANFSATPHVLFKHPAHHAEAMARELGTDDAYPFFTDRQALWRRVADLSSLEQAFSFITT